jgi:hypothetical protein
MLVGTHQRFAKVSSFCIVANEYTLSRVYQFKYLGVMLDTCLSWNDHIDYITRKISSRLGMLRRARKVIPREACITHLRSIMPWYFHYLIIAPVFGTTVGTYSIALLGNGIFYE